MILYHIQVWETMEIKIEYLLFIQLTNTGIALSESGPKDQLWRRIAHLIPINHPVWLLYFSSRVTSVAY